MSRDRALRAADGDAARLQALGWGDAPATAPLAHLDATGPHGRGAAICDLHPLRWLELEPEFAPIVDLFQVVEPKLVTREDYARRSNLEVESLLTMQGAFMREQNRRMRAAAADHTRGSRLEEIE